MSFIEVEKGKAFYCEAALDHPALVVENKVVEQAPITLGGTFTIDGGDIRLRLVRFDKIFHVPDGARLEARTEENWVASLFDIVRMGVGRAGGGNRTSYSENVLVNTALIGWDIWSKDDRVRRTQFRVPEADLLLRHRPTFNGLANNPIGKAPEHLAFDVPVTGGYVRIRYGASGSTDSNYPRDIWPLVEMEFDEGISLTALRKQTITMLRFLSASASMRLSACEQTVSRLSHAEWLGQIEKGEHPHDYSVYYYEKEQERSKLSNLGRLYGAFAFLYGDEERSAFIACLQAWFARNADWEGAASAMMDAFSFRDVMSPERLLNATKWIEATPGVKAHPVMSEEHILALCKLVSRNAVRLGYRAISGRLRNSLRQIASEQNVQRFARLVADLKVCYGDQVVGDDLAEWVAEAFSWRGKAAHRPIIGQTEAEYECFAKATHAAECFAYLMLLRDLPMSHEGKKRVESAPLVEEYRFGIKGQRPRDIK